MSYCWRSLIELRGGGIRHQPRERCDAGFRTRGLQEPLTKLQHVQPHGC
jgi:hypothetical protein